MGFVIDADQEIDEELMDSTLLIYLNTYKGTLESKSISKDLSNELMSCDETRRSIKFEQIFSSVLGKYPDGVIIKDIDVMFNPSYKIDVLKILIAARKKKKFSVIWSGRLDDEKLKYGEEGYSVR